MAQVETPITQQRRLRAELKRAREQSGMTQKDVAVLLDWSPSKVIRIETGAAIISTSDLQALLPHYGITDRKRIDELVEVARASRKQAWWDEYRGVYDQQFLTFLGYEASTIRLRSYQALLIPGLLQTSAYTNAILRAYTDDEEAIVRGAQVRGKRQHVLEPGKGPEMFFVLDEAALHRWVGGSEVMREQLLWLEELNKRPNIQIQVVPFTVGAHPGMRGAFTIFEFPFEDEDFALLLEHPDGDVLIQNKPDIASTYVETFFDLEAIATPKGDLSAVLRPILDMFPGAKTASAAKTPATKAQD
ncbi:helix-turn-helix domain-containing protein [Actinophytocola glycyrrhizae]|uniref:Helix-turn-helix domain-containing protein n=1 Tax=Actinophytocola glycyrrhizae TaxID=2044873 RepID=A0ABV9S972_9PSEU